MLIKSSAAVLLFTVLAMPCYSQSDNDKRVEANKDNAAYTDDAAVHSPWIFTPLVSVNPKLSAAAGALAAYMHKFDELSPASMFGATANYSETKSWTAVAFAQAYFDEGRQRFSGAYVAGTIHNDYDDYLGTGLPLKTTDSLNFFLLRYTYQVWGNWHLGTQVQNSIYGIKGVDEGSDFVISTAGLDGFDSVGAGLVIEYDSKDRQRSSTAGNYLLLQNTAYRKSFGGDESFDAYEAQFTNYLAHGDGNVLAINTSGRWTHDAPASGYSSVYTKAYTRGQYLAEHSTSIELDERLHFSENWGMSVYAGLACLYGNSATGDVSCSDTKNLYPSLSLGAIYHLKPAQGIVIRAEFAKGKSDNQGFYLSFGQPF